MSSMKAMNSRKRVSFGSKGSMVETWIIEDLPTPRTEKEEEFFAGFVPHSKSDPGLHAHTTTACTDNPHQLVSLSPLRDTSHRVRVLSDPQGLSPWVLENMKGSLYVTDRVTGWPLKRSPSLESRDNPFLPGGDLSKEAEELLKKATIVRDKFFLEQEQEKLLQDTEQPGARPDPIPESTNDVADGTLPNASNSSEVVEERICPSVVSQVEAAAPPQPRENGKAGDVPALEASPDKVRLEVGDSPTADGSTAVANDTDAEQQQDKPKRRPKCCLLM